MSEPTETATLLPGTSLHVLTVPHGVVPVGGRIDVRAELTSTPGWSGTVDLRADDELIASAVVDVAPGRAVAVQGWWTATKPGDVVISARADAGTAHTTITCVATATPALPWFTGAWLDPGALAASPIGYGLEPVATGGDVEAMVDSLAALGVTTVIVTYVESAGAFYYPSEIEFFDRDLGAVTRGSHLDYDYLESVLGAADRNGQTVWLGLGRGGDTPLLWEFDAKDWSDRNDQAVDLGVRVADELWGRYRHHRSLGGWYLTHEMNDLARAGGYYDPLCRHLRSLSPARPVLAAPAGTPIVDPDLLRASEVDVFAYQDAVGAGYVPFEYTWDPQRRLDTLDEVYATYRDAHTGTDKHLWADIEVWEMDGADGYRGSYPPAWDRVRQQIEIAARHVDNLTAYEWSGFVEHPHQRPRRPDRRASDLYSGYRDHLDGLRPPTLGPDGAP